MASMNEITTWLPLLFTVPVAVVLGVAIGAMLGGDE